jgi:uncharacterized protein YqhQ
MPQKTEKIDTMGGQAVIEGVLMRSPSGYSIAVRRPSTGEITVKSVPYVPITKRYKVLGLPFIRGTVVLFEMLIIGMKALDFSAQEWQRDAELTEKHATETVPSTPPEPASSASPAPSSASKPTSPVALVGMIVIALALAMFLMVVIPNFLTSYLGRLAIFAGTPTPQVVSTGEPGRDYVSSERSALVEEHSPLVYNLIAGFLRATIIFGYIVAISFMKDIRRIFQYHGAEHKVVFAFERGDPLTVEHARKYSTRHPRCGTAFLAVVIFVSIIAFSFIAKFVITLYPQFTTMNFFLKKGILISLHILFMPFVAGTSYELIRYASRHQDKWLLRALVYPGILFQKITTRDPDDDQVEVAIASLKSTLALANPSNGPEKTD